MLGTLIQKELRMVLLSPRFAATFTVCTVLILLSVVVGVLEYKQSVAQYTMAQQLGEERLQQTSNLRNVKHRLYRKPEPLQIFSSGQSFDIGRWSNISGETSVKLVNSPYSDDPVFAVFRMLDFTFIVQVVLSLFALLFTYDAVSSEKEMGTLRLIFSNSVARAQYILGKCIGCWLGLIIPLLIPVLLSVLLVVSFGIEFSGSEWIRLIALLGISLLYVTVFVVLGVFISTLTKQTNVSFLLSLVLWVAFVLIIPRTGVMAAANLAPVQRLAEVEGLRDGFAKERWEEFYKNVAERWSEVENSNMSDDGEFDETVMWENMQAEDSLRKEVYKEIEKYEILLMEDLRNRQAVQRTLGLTLARISPAATHQLASGKLAGTDLDLKSRYETEFTDFRVLFNDYVEEKTADAGPGAGAVMITMDSDKGMNIATGRDKAGLDLSDRPRFELQKRQIAGVLQSVVVDAGIELILILIAFVGAFAAFLRYDVR